MSIKYTIEIYRLYVDSGTFSRVDIIDNFEGLKFSTVLNNIGTCTFDVPIYNSKMTNSNLVRFRNHVCIKRNDTVVWFGPIVEVSFDGSDVSGYFHIFASTMLYHFKSRFTDKLKIYTQTDQADIMWGLINESQSRTNGSVGISRGYYTSSVSRDRTYEYYEICQALINLSDVINGADFDFSTTTDSYNKVNGVLFNVYYPSIGRTRNDAPTLKVGDNIESFKCSTISDLTNFVTCEGSGTGSTSIYSSENQDLELGYTRREKLLIRKDISTYSEIQEHAIEELTNNGVERFSIDIQLRSSCNITVGSFIPGDILNIDLGYSKFGSYTDIRKTGLVKSISVDASDGLSEKLTPKLEIL